MKNIGLNSKKAYEELYGRGYGVMYPESHIIRIYEHFLKYQLGVDKMSCKRFFDFGCGNGTHALYFHSKGFEVYGVDIIESSISMCKKRIPEQADNFKIIKPNQDIDNLFKVKFGVALANQSLYYLSNTNLNKILTQLYNMLDDGGIVVFTMMGAENYYYKLAEKLDHDGLQKVTLTGRLNHTTYVNFIKDEEDLIERFKLFKPLFIGDYDFSLKEGSSFHYYFVGRK